MDAPFDHSIRQQEGQKFPKRWVAQAAIRLATAVIKFRKGNVDRQPKRTNNIKTKGRITPISNLAMMVIYLPVKFEFDWTKRFRVRAQKRKC